MYFPGFKDNKDRFLSEDLTYTVEALVSQVLATADVSALEAALQKHNIVNMLIDELRFLGYVPKSELPKVQRLPGQTGTDPKGVRVALGSRA
jgi:hypothetical protein